MKQKLASAAAILVLVLLIAGVVGLTSLVGVSLLNVLGFSYTSWGELGKFLLVYLVLDVVTTPFATALPEVLHEQGKIKNPRGALYFGLDTGLTFLAVELADLLIAGVEIPWTTALGFGAVFALLDKAFDRAAEEN